MNKGNKTILIVMLFIVGFVLTICNYIGAFHNQVGLSVGLGFASLLWFLTLAFCYVLLQM